MSNVKIFQCRFVVPFDFTWQMKNEWLLRFFTRMPFDGEGTMEQVNCYSLPNENGGETAMQVWKFEQTSGASERYFEKFILEMKVEKAIILYARWFDLQNNEGWFEISPTIALAALYKQVKV